MGGPKVLLTFEGVSLLRRHLEVFAAAGIERTTVVVRPELVATLRARLGSAQAADLVAAETASPASSLAVGTLALERQLGAAGLAPRAILISPIDKPAGRPDTVRRLLETLGAGALAATPSIGGRDGHPVALRGVVLNPYLDVEPPTLKTLLTGLGERRRRVTVDDETVLCDFDTPAELERLGLGLPRFS